MTARSTRRNSTSTKVKSFYLPQSPLRFLSGIPSQIWFALLGMLGLANYARQIVRVRARSSGALTITSASNRTAAVEQTTVDEWIERNVPSLRGTYTPSWWLPNGHMQTFYIIAGNFAKTDMMDYKRTLLRVPDGGTIGIDMAPLNHEELPDNAPTIVVCHGLTGNAHESYIRNVLHWAIKPVAEGGLGARGVVVNFRGCGKVPLTSPQFYSAAASSDLNTAVHYLRNRFPESALHGMGFSLGASVMSRYLGEHGSESLIASGCVLGCPWDIEALSHALEDGWFSSRVYSRALGNNLLKLFFRHYDVNPGMFERDDSPLKDVVPELKRLRKDPKLRLKAVDEVLTTRAGGPMPPWPFPSADDYYKYAGSHQLVHNIKVPTLGINAMDDPVVHGDALPIEQIKDASHVHVAVTGGGGHLGWFDGPMFGPRSRDRWVRTPIAEFLTAATRDLAPAGAPVHTIKEVDGWTWVDADPMVPQTGAEPVRIGWRVLSDGIETPLHPKFGKFDGQGGGLQGL